MNEKLVTNIKKAKIPTIMTTNAGTKILDTEANIPNFGRAMLDASQSANVLGFSHLRENFRVTYDSNVEDAFVVHTNCGPVKFVNRERLYVYEPSEKYFELIRNMKLIENSDPDKTEQNENDKKEENEGKVHQLNEETNSQQPIDVCQVIPSVKENMQKYSKNKLIKQ